MATDYIQKLVTFLSGTKQADAKKKTATKPGMGASKPVSGDIFSFAERLTKVSEGKAPSIFTSSIKDLDKLDLSGDSVTLHSKKQNEETEGAEGSETSKKHNNLYKTLEELYKDPTFASIIDKDGDQKISDEEAKEFIKSISELDGKAEDFSVEDLKIFLDKAKGKLAEAEQRAVFDARAREALSQMQQPLVPNSPMMNYAQPSGFNFGNLGGRGGGGWQVPYKVPKSLDEQKGELEEKINNYKNELAQINSGDQATVKAAIDAEKQAKAAMEEQLKKDENVEQSLKDKLNEVNQKITSKKSEISQKSTELSTAEADLSQGQNRLSTLQSSLSSLAQPTGNPEDADKDASINTRRQELQQQIAEQENKNKELEQKITQAKQEKENLEGELTTLEQERTSVEQEIAKGAAPETKQAIDAHKQAEKNVETVKESETTRVQGELKTAQDELNTLDSQIEMRNNKRAEGSSAEAALDYALNFNGKSAAEMAQIMMSKGYSFHNGAWCADFVNFATGMGGAERPAWYEGCSNRSYCPTVQAAGLAAGAGVPLNEAKPGDLVMFDFKGQGEPHHIGIFHSYNSDGTINVMEGNTGGAARLKKRNVGTVSSVLSMTC